MSYVEDYFFNFIFESYFSILLLIISNIIL